VLPFALLAASGGAEQPSEPSSPQSPAPHEEEHAIAEGLPSDSPDLQVRMFGDLGLRGGDRKDETWSFALGQLDAFLTSRLSDSLSVLSEIAVRSAGSTTGATSPSANTLTFSLERLLLQYSRSDYLRIAAGRYHTAIGYYNTAYHHGTWFQTATGRPFLFAFERDGGILPSHNVGFTVSGRIPSGRLGLRYVAEVGNGRAYAASESVQNVVDDNDFKALNVALIARPAWTSGLQAGVSVYYDHLSPARLPRLSQTITAVHAVYHGSKLELLNEAVFIRHARRDAAGSFETPGFYSQASRQIGHFRPYARYQYLDADPEDPIVGAVGRRSGPSLGLRYDVGEFVAAKLQYDRTSTRRRIGSGVQPGGFQTLEETVNELTLQLAFTF